MRRAIAIKRLLQTVIYAMTIIAVNALSQTEEAPSIDDAPNATPAIAAKEHPNNQVLTGINTLASEATENATWMDLSAGKILGIFSKSRQKTSKGAVLILTTLPLSNELPETIRTVQLTLPDHGWDTFIVDTTAIAQTDDRPTAQTDDSQHINEIFTASIKFLHEQNQLNVVVLSDNLFAPKLMSSIGSQFGSDSVKNSAGINGPIQALVVLNIHSSTFTSTSDLKTIFAQKDLPTADIFTGPQTKYLQLQKKSHLAAANQQKIKSYTQIEHQHLSHYLTPEQTNFLVKRIRGFLDKHSGGREIEANITTANGES